MRATQANSFLSLAFFSSITLSNAASLAKRAPPATLAGGYTYQGCYVDVGRTISAAATADATMTNQKCAAFCSSKGYTYAGTEYHNECYCGNALATGGVLANEADCSTTCSGDATQPCGGPNRLTLYKTDVVATGPSVNPGVNNFTSIGCYSEGTTGRALTFGVGTIPGAEMTVAKCTAACKAANFILAGVEYAGECYCGNTIANGGAPAVDGCNMLCNGNSSEYCGGGNRLNVYDYMMQYPVSSTSTSTRPATSSAVGVSTTRSVSSTRISSSIRLSSVSTVRASTSTILTSSSRASVSASSSTAAGSASPTPTGPSQPATVGAYNWYGCQTEATNARALTGKTTASDTMTLETCQAFCAGFTYFGVEYSRECYCGNSFSAGSVLAAPSDCNMVCMGNQFQYCGAGNRLSVYTLGNAPPPVSSSTRTGSVTTSSAAPVGTGFPTGWSDQGCWVDGAQGRILEFQAPDDQTLTQQSCAALCNSRGYKISGTEYHAQCFCGNAIVNGGVKAANPADCNTACAGNPNQMCGGGGRMTIISNGPPTVYGPPEPQKSGFNGAWTYQGCVVDNLNDKRTFYWQNIFPGTMTANMCLDRCAEFGYMAAGLEYGQECYCGDPANVATAGVTFRPESECNVVCAGNSSSICGGGSRMSTYFWTGTPLYSWTFPQTPATAGSYELLIGGVCIPLMTMQSITGKVTFLEKWGTGPANSTGAYELDLTKVNDFPNAWRPMHVKTDIFCSAGVVLPDKAGRQLTIGGWSGDSTYGVRLYWPDGAPGQPSVNDWQENVSALKLQAGRWYPSAMIMANGSIMVIGGEEGSNGAAVPSIELLPYTGTAPLYMDWLDRTNPNNLYPFVSVLPSKDIFVAYWNEARILDAATFATKKILPNIPGAVNNPMGGRTYPLEGTGVLLPQRAPYTAPLGVLICGGSTEGAATALDNCVSIEPEAAVPKWTIERMPSRRVISCMAPLPDGTYLINNGAQHGVAGFGLAQDPNLNALLYDPTKPVGSRITVMANTTIARLYHSESITLLDGRVLVTGSDPDDGVNPQEYRVEVFNPPYLTGGKPRPTFTITNKDWAYGATATFTLGAAARNGAITVSLLGAVSSTHGNSMGARTIFPAVTCNGLSCTVTAPPNSGICPPGWYQFFVLDGGIPAVGVYVRIGGDPAGLGNWPQGPGLEDFKRPGL